MQPVHTPQAWDEASAAYDANLSAFTSQYADDALGFADLHDAMHALEVAAGSGALTLKLAPRVKRLTAVDYSRGMLEALRQKLDDHGHDHVETHQMDGMALTFDDDSFDAAFCQFGVMLFSDPYQGMVEMARVVRPGGTAVISGWAGPDRFESFGVFGQALRKALPDMPPPEGPPPIFRLANPVSFAAQLREAGFSSARVEHVTYTMKSPSAETYVEVFTTSAPPARALRGRIGDEGMNRVKSALHAILTERFGGGEVALSNTATVGVATR